MATVAVSWEDVIKEFGRDIQKSFASKPKSKLYFSNSSHVESCAEAWISFLIADALITVLKQDVKRISWNRGYNQEISLRACIKKFYNISKASSSTNGTKNNDPSIESDKTILNQSHDKTEIVPLSSNPSVEMEDSSDKHLSTELCTVHGQGENKMIKDTTDSMILLLKATAVAGDLVDSSSASVIASMKNDEFEPKEKIEVSIENLSSIWRDMNSLQTYWETVRVDCKKRVQSTKNTVSNYLIEELTRLGGGDLSACISHAVKRVVETLPSAHLTTIPTARRRLMNPKKKKPQPLFAREGFTLADYAFPLEPRIQYLLSSAERMGESSLSRVSPQDILPKPKKIKLKSTVPSVVKTENRSEPVTELSCIDRVNALLMPLPPSGLPFPSVPSSEYFPSSKTNHVKKAPKKIPAATIPTQNVANLTNTKSSISTNQNVANLTLPKLLLPMSNPSQLSSRATSSQSLHSASSSQFQPSTASPVSQVAPADAEPKAKDSDPNNMNYRFLMILNEAVMMTLALNGYASANDS